MKWIILSWDQDVDLIDFFSPTQATNAALECIIFDWTQSKLLNLPITTFVCSSIRLRLPDACDKVSFHVGGTKGGKFQNIWPIIGLEEGIL